MNESRLHSVLHGIFFMYKKTDIEYYNRRQHLMPEAPD
jgi:hypothetical protein